MDGSGLEPGGSAGLSHLKDRSVGVWRVFLALLLVGCTWLIAVQPLSVGDTDLWYHLNGGRFISENGSLPDGSFFSFLEPYRTFTDYYWLFQFLVYKLYSAGGYAALVFLRWLLYVSYIFVAWKMFEGWTGGRGARGVGLSAYLLLAVVLIAGTRLINLRPHCFSYLAALSFIYILERQRRKAWLLPLIALLWVNFHGITYPVLWVITLSYLAPLALRRLRGRAPERDGLIVAVSLTLSMSMVWATPNGGALLSVPFKFSKYSNEYIAELLKLNIPEFLTQAFVLFLPKGITAFTVYFVVVVLTLAVAARRRELSAAHLFLFLGGLFLLTRATRFTIEFSLLCLPLAALAPKMLFSPREDGRFAPKIALVAFISSVIYFGAYNIVPQKGALSHSLLPTGNMAFLKSVGTGGRVLNHPNSGGFLQWELYPRYKILMDMQIPFLFEDEDMFLVVEAGARKGVLEELTRKYKPEYASFLYREESLMKRLSESGEYALVFFDDAGALFANRKLVPEVVEKYELKELPLIERHGKPFKALAEGKDKAKIKEELKSVLALWPGNGMANLWLTQAAMVEEDYEASLKYAQTAEAEYPNSVQVLSQKGDALRKLGRHEEALDCYRRGMRHADASGEMGLKRGIAYTYKAMGDPSNAYKYFSDSTKVLSPSTSAEDLWQFAMSAYLSGHEAEGVELARFAELRAGTDEAEPGEAIRKFLSQVEAQPIQGGFK